MTALGPRSAGVRRRRRCKLGTPRMKARFRAIKLWQLCDVSVCGGNRGNKTYPYGHIGI